MSDGTTRRESTFEGLSRRIGRVPRAVAISAAFGIDGGAVARQVARRSGLPFVGDDVPAIVAARLQVPLAEAVALDGRAPSRLARALQCAGAGACVPELVTAGDEVLALDRFRAASDDTQRRLADGGAVLVGRAAPLVLAGHPRLLAVRLTAGRERRVERVAVAHGLDRRAARRLVQRADRAEADYASHTGRVDVDDPSHYDLCIDALALDADTVVDVIVSALR